MNPSLFHTQTECQQAMVAAVPPLADVFCLRTNYTEDGYSYGSPNPLQFDPQTELRHQVLPEGRTNGFPFF